eukprot:14700988-Alexandrium_andersonii.AAC.1
MGQRRAGPPSRHVPCTSAGAHNDTGTWRSGAHRSQTRTPLGLSALGPHRWQADSRRISLAPP